MLREHLLFEERSLLQLIRRLVLNRVLRGRIELLRNRKAADLRSWELRRTTRERVGHSSRRMARPIVEGS